MPGHQHKTVLRSETGHSKYEYKVKTSCLGVHTVPEFWCEDLEKTCPSGHGTQTFWARTVNVVLDLSET